ncbi:MAG: 2-oxoacid:acceptor oxidoreductase subunit alpha [Chloroflexi bacterium]|nr:2-oxoacid:acceptor oxidoreductase subunit alpha [Chloroflexota bacterium]
MAKESGDVREVDRVTIRFAGDSGDGSQLAGQQFTNTAAIFGNDVSTVPDYPAEIRAPAGSLPGVSSFQVSFSSHEIYTAGDNPDVLVAMNPAALKTNLPDVPKGSLIIINADEFTEANFRKADYEADPREDGTLAGFRLIQVPITSMNARALKESGLPQRQIDRSKNLFALGVMFWLYERSLDPTLNWIDGKFAKNPQVAEANKTTLKAGFYFGETAELFSEHYRVPKANPRPGKYRNITGNEATALGFLAASQLLKKPLFYASYPITPASDILIELAKYKSFGVKTMQSEDELSAIGAAIGASFGGALGLTGTSGPGLALKSEAIGLAVMTELPVVIANVQRSGPSTGMPSKTEQGDLLQAMFGRNGESPLAIVAPATPAECFDMAIEAFRIATKFMVPTIFLSDGHLGSGSEPWRIPAIEDLPKMKIENATDPENFQPYRRDETTLARPWAVPGTPGLEHRIGGLEKSDITGDVRYDAENHERMTRLRAEKVERIADDIPELEVDGEPSGELLVLGWGSTFGAIITAVYRAQADGLSVSAAHLRYLNPFPRNLGDVLSQFERVLIPEMNLGQLRLLIRARYLVDAEGLNIVTGRPMKTADVAAKIQTLVRRKVSVA